uniref:Complex III subunit VI n=1 Tax=Zea mays TaxID=4577 RepID=A0A804P1Q0_MAIZE
MRGEDEELVDQKKYLEERCKPQCVKSLYEYEKCVKRVENDDTGHKHCTGQYFDYWSCIDKCSTGNLTSLQDVFGSSVWMCLVQVCEKKTESCLI